MDADRWGPAGWTYLHAVTLSYPDAPSDLDRVHYRQFFDLVGKTLPCVACRHHFSEALHTTPPDLTSRAALTDWLISVHNGVRRRQGKPTIDGDDAMRHIHGIPEAQRRVVAVSVTATVGALLLVALVACVVLMCVRPRRSQ